MRTAEEILSKHSKNYFKWDENEKTLDKLVVNGFEVINAINDARKEAIEECADRAKATSWNDQDGLHQEVDEQSILSLINELK